MFSQKPKIKNQKPQQAFTLIEILLAIGILALGITAVLFLFTIGARSHKRAVDRTRAALLAQTVLNQIKADLLAPRLPERYNIDEDDPVPIPPIQNARSAEFPEFYYTVTFDPLLPDARFYKVRVQVRWGEESAEAEERNSETFTTVLQRKKAD